MPYSPLPTPAIGGDIVAILLQRSLRRRAASASQGSYFPPGVWIGSVPISAKTQETYTYAADIPEHAVESGALFSDHVILHPIKIDVSFEVTNFEPGFAAYALELLETLWRTREPVELLTEHKLLQNMVLMHLDVSNSLPNWGSLVCRATFKELKLVTLETVEVSSEQVTPTEDTPGEDASKSAASATELGQVSIGAQVWDSVSSAISGAFGG